MSSAGSEGKRYLCGQANSSWTNHRLYESKVRQQNQTRSSYPDRHPHPQWVCGSRSVLSIIQRCSSRPRGQESSTWGRHLPQMGLGWGQCFGHDYRQVSILSPLAILAQMQENQMDPCLSKQSSLRQSYWNLRAYLLVSFQCVFIFQWIYCFKEDIVFICRLFHGMTAGEEHGDDKCNQALLNVLYFHH